MSIVCLRCGGTHVTCSGVVNPNTGKMIEVDDYAFEEGWCNGCRDHTVLHDAEAVKTEIKTGYMAYMASTGTEPQYACCYLVNKTSTVSLSRFIRLAPPEDYTGRNYPILEKLKSLAEFPGGECIITHVRYFTDKATDEKLVIPLDHAALRKE